jgi:branched-chain amino acid transport system substrate-binding protein
MTARIKPVALVVSVVALAVTVSTGLAASTASPGVTATSVTIGGTFPLTGPAQLYGLIPKAENAYFQYVNAHGGVNHRKINFIIEDDAYNPAQTVPQTQKLVQQDHIFADVGSLGTAPTLSTRAYLNGRKVPQVLVATGDSYWGAQYKKYPWTIGFQPDYPGEGKIYGRFIRNKVPQAKVGVLIQDDAFGANYLAGLKAGLGPAASRIVDVEKYPATQTDVSQQVVKLKSAGANVFALFALPTQTIDALVVATKVGWSPVTFIANVSNNPLFMYLAQKSGANIQNDISTNYVYDYWNNPNTPTAKLIKSILDQYDPGWNPLDANNVYGLAEAWTFVHALQKAGNPPTRAGLMNALTHLNAVNPFLFQGFKMRTTPSNRFPITQLTLEHYKGSGWIPFGRIYNDAK